MVYTRLSHLNNIETHGAIYLPVNEIVTHAIFVTLHTLFVDRLIGRAEIIA